MNDMNWIAVYPEMVLLGMTCLIALLDLFSTSPKRTATYLLSLATLAVVATMQPAVLPCFEPYKTFAFYIVDPVFVLNGERFFG